MYVNQSIWHDDAFRQLSEYAKSTYLYLLTSPHSNMMGFYVLPLEYMAFDMSRSIKECENCLEDLLKRDLIGYDKKARTILVKDHLKHNPIGGPSQLKGVVNLLKEMPPTHLTATFYELIKGYLTDQTKSYLEDVKALIPNTETETKMAKGRK